MSVSIYCITPSEPCSSAPLPEVRCYVQTVVEPGTPRVGGRWSASIAPGQARALQQGRGAVAHRSPRWPRSPSPWHKRTVGSPPTGWPPTGNQDGKCKLRCAGLTAPADGPSFVTGQTLWAAKFFNVCLLPAGRAKNPVAPRRARIIGGFILRSSLVFLPVSASRRRGNVCQPTASSRPAPS
jgi:hypothetical protein